MTFLDNHHGPFCFCVSRPHKTKKGFFTSEWLMTPTERDDVESEARALLEDTRDTITNVGVWSLRENCFVGGYTR
jgi:hypothetical protein